MRALRFLIVLATLAGCARERGEMSAAGAGDAPTAGAGGVSGEAGHAGMASGMGGIGGSGAIGGTGATGGVGGAGGMEPHGGDPELLSPEVRAQWQALQLRLEDAQAMTHAQLVEAYSYAPEALGYDPLTADHLDLIAASPVAMNEAQQQKLGENGFVILGDKKFPTFTYAYQTIYMADLPVYVSADSILDAVHRSYDDMLMEFEYRQLIPQLQSLLDALSTALASTPATQTRADLDVYLTVARSLLSGATVAPSAGGDGEQIETLVQNATAAAGPITVTLFGKQREIDASQFKPRGHYEGELLLEQYFRAMIWLGRTDFTLVETTGASGEQVLNRPQVEAMLLLDSLFTPDLRATFEQIDDVIRAFVGESDNMTLAQIPALREALGVSGDDIAAIDDATLMATIIAHGFGKQQIMSSLMEGGVDGPVPFNSSFLLFGQRYVVDSHVFSNVVWDRTTAKRMMPDPLDAAFAALGNNQALPLLSEQLDQYAYSGNLAAMRVLIDDHDESFWEANLYNRWLTALRALSPATGEAAEGLPAIAQTEAWGRRILNTQLASWSQLRHDTILYAKQSYTSGATCEFPDAMVDPYPELYAALERYATHGQSLAELASDEAGLQTRIAAYFEALGTIAGTLKGMAEHQRTGEPFTEEQLAFINDAVVINTVPSGCTSALVPGGWYARLFYLQERALEHDPIIADVHTQPTDEAGNDVGRILHVATADPRAMVVTVDTCVGPRAYVGAVSSYYEPITDGWQRLTDREWSARLASTNPADKPSEVRWVADLIE